MLILSPRNHKLHWARGTLVEDAEIRHVVKFMRDIAGPTYERHHAAARAIRTSTPRDEREQLERLA